MDSEDEGMTFVNLLEEHKEILDVSQIPANKKKKMEGVELFIPKWESVCGKKLTQAALFKKVNNIKSRCKLAVINKRPLAAWQLKFVELTKAHDEQENGVSTESTETSNDSLKVYRTPTAVQNSSSKYETDETVFLNNEQLQRLVLLKQLRVANLQLKKMEENNSSEVQLDFIGWDGDEAVEAFKA